MRFLVTLSSPASHESSSSSHVIKSSRPATNKLSSSDKLVTLVRGDTWTSQSGMIRNFSLLQVAAALILWGTLLSSGSLGFPADEQIQHIKQAREQAETVFRAVKEELAGNSFDNLLRKKNLQHVTETPDHPDCIGCVSGVYLVQYYIRKNKTTPEITHILEKLCVALDYGNPTFCKELTSLLGDTIVTILNTTKNTAMEVCSFVKNLNCGNGDVPGHRWTLKLPGGKPPAKARAPPKADTPKLRVLHLTDTHYDPLYKEGTRDICPMWMCCRVENGMANKNESAAGTWGGWKCDIPERTLDDFLAHVTKTHPKFDYILWTGDIPAHASWKQTKEESIFMLRSTVAKILKYFPNTPIFPALGNHEACPADLYPSPSINRPNVNSWLFKELVEQWSLMLPNTTLKTIGYAGFYEATVKPKLRIISLNTNFCYSANMWLILNSTDPANMLQWFTERLQKAEVENVKIHVIAHIPPGYIDCLKIWGKNFYNIISRFENTVTAQFYGHTHNDEIEIFYDTETTKRAVSVGYVGPSVTTYTFANPGYRIYTVDGVHNESAYDVYDFEAWVMDLEKSNKDGKTYWSKLYSAKDAYKMASLQPGEWNKFYEKLKTDDKLLDTYDRHYWKDSPKRPKCGAECRRSHLFDIRSGVHYGPPEVGPLAVK